MMKDKAIDTNMPAHQCYKCPQCSFYCSDADQTIKHCHQAHNMRKATLIEGAIGSHSDVKQYIEEKKNKERCSFNPKRMHGTDITEYNFLLNR